MTRARQFYLPVICTAAAVVLCLQLICIGDVAWGADDDALRDGISVIEGLKRTKKPGRNKIIDKAVGLMRRGKSETRTTKVDANTDPNLLKDPEYVFLKNPDKSISYIRKDRLREAFQAVADDLTRRPEADELWQDMKAQMNPLVWLAATALERSGNLMDTIRAQGAGLAVDQLADDEKYRRAARTAIQSDKDRKKPASTQPALVSVPTVKPPDCTPEKAQVSAAQQNIAAGQLGTAEATLLGLDLVKCPGLTTQVDAALQAITNTVDDLNARAAAASDSCNAAEIDKVANDLDNVSHSGLTGSPADLKSRAQAIVSAKTEYTAAQANLKAGQLATVLSQLRSLGSAMETAGLRDCEPYDKARRGITKITDLITTRVDQANVAANRCDMNAITRLLRHLSRLNHPDFKAALARLEAAKADCQEPDQQTAELTPADQRCIDQHGSASYSKDSGADGINICGCRDPYIFNFDGTRCVRPDQLMADANTSCQESFGPGAYANSSQSSYKTYVCECGSGTTWNCGKRRCVKTAEFMSALRTHATEICQGRFGSALRRVQVNPSCKYSCVIAQRTVRRTPTRRRTPGQRAPTRTHDKGLSVIIGVIGVISQMPTSSPSSSTDCRANPMAANC